MRRLGPPALYAALALAATWPLALHPGWIPLGTETVATVPLASQWLLGEAGPALLRGLAWNDAPILAPATHTLLLTEARVLQGWLALPGTLLGLPLGVVATLLLWGEMTANGLAARFALQAWGTRAATAGGAAMVVLPGVLHELGVPVLVSIWPLLLALGFAAKPERWVGLGAALAAAGWACSQYLLLAAMTAWPLLLARRKERAWALLLAGALLAPLAWGHAATAAEHGRLRSKAAVATGSMPLEAWARTGWEAPLAVGARVGGDPALFPGWAALGLALLGLRRRDAFAARVGASLVLCALVASGPRLVGTSNFLAAVGWIPGAESVRGYWRAGLLGQALLTLLAARGLDALPGRWGPAAAALLVVELWPPPQVLVEPPRPAGLELVLEHGAGETLAVLPLPAGARDRHYEDTAGWMWRQREHGARLVAGYASFAPRSWGALRTAAAGWPDAAAVDALRGAGATLVLAEQAPVGATVVAGGDGLLLVRLE